MRLEKCRLRGIGPFDDWTVDLTQFSENEKLIAVTGVNGSGKSFFLESSIAGACWRDMPTQGSIVKRATSADSLLESTIVHAGRRLTIRHVIDGVRGKSEAVVIGEDGQPLWKKAGPKVFDEWADAHLPDRDVVFSSIFAAQQSEGFVKMTSGDRIGVMLRVIGVARLERKAAAARKLESECSQKLGEIVRRIDDIRGGALLVADAEKALAEAAERVREAEGKLEAARAGLSRAQQEAADHAIQAAARAAATTRRQEIDALLAAARAKLDGAPGAPGLLERLRNNRAVLDDRDRIEAAVVRTEELKTELVALEAAGLAADAEARRLLEPWTDAPQRLQEAKTRAQRARVRLIDADAIGKAVAALEGLRAAVDDARIGVSTAELGLESLRSQRLAGADERNVLLRGSIGAMIGIARQPFADFSSEEDLARQVVAEGESAIDADNAASKAATETPGKLKEAQAKLATERDRLALAERRLSDAEKLAARAGESEGAQADLDAAEQEAQRIEQGRAEATERAQVERFAADAARAKARTCKTELESLAALAGRAVPLAAAAEKIAVYEPEVAAAEHAFADHTAALAALVIPDVPPSPNVAQAESLVRAAGQAMQECADARSRAQQQLEQAHLVETRVAALETERLTVEADLSDWARLALDHGRTGMQSSEVDAAGPELATLTNDLLHFAYGPRFTVSVETQRLDSTGKKLIDECNIRVIDTEAGTEKEVREHSGGERTILAEALSLGLTMLACNRAGFDRPTIVRDESGAALDPAAARAWVKMLRRAIAHTGADRLLFVSHNDEIVALADATIEPPARQTSTPIATEAA